MSLLVHSGKHVAAAEGTQMCTWNTDQSGKEWNMRRIQRITPRFTVCFAVVVAAIVAVAVQAESRSAGAAAFKPVQPIEKMMEGQKKLFGEIKDGILDGKYKEAATSAWILAEVANANQFQHTAPEYKKLASTMSRQCAELAEALGRRAQASSGNSDQDKQLRDSVSQIGRTCGACHDTFRKD